MNENKNPIDAIIKEAASTLTPSLDDFNNRPFEGVFPEGIDNFSDFELRTLEDDPAFLELLSSFKNEVEQNRKSSNRTFIVALLSLIIGCVSLTWSIAEYLMS